MKYLLIFCLSFLFAGVYAQKFETVSYGFWNNPAVWKDGLKPNFSFSDTVIVKHPIVFDSTLIVLPNAYFKIDSSGAICGHKNFITHSKVHAFGYFQCDSLEVDGGMVKIFGPGDCVSSFQTHIFNGGSLSVSGGSLAVGPWFECRDSDFFYLGTSQEKLNHQLEIFPNPVSDFLTIKGDLFHTKYVLFDYLGKIIINGEASSKLDVSFLETGIYFLQLFDEGTIKHIEKIIKD